MLGIEVVCVCIIEEIDSTMGVYGMLIDNRYSMLFVDVMTYKGEVFGIMCFGMVKMKDFVFMLVLFEKIMDYLFDVVLYGCMDYIDGVFECIIMGILMFIGTGMFRL